jgi:tetratricopeptide (TPR) repeat protein
MLRLAMVVAVVLGDPGGPAAVRPLTEHVAAEHARNASLPPLAPPRPTPPSPRRGLPKYEPEPVTGIYTIRKATPFDHPDYPELLLDLALTFAAKRTYYLDEAAALDDGIRAVTAAHAEALRSGRDAGRQGALAAEAERLRSRREKFRVQAAEAGEQQHKLLRVLITTPTFKGRPVEEALYLHARERAAEDRPEGFDAALRLIQEFPDSPYRAYAYALFAHRYLLRGKPAYARQIVSKLLVAPPAPLAASLQLYLGWSYMRSGAGEGPLPDLALAAFTRAVAASTTSDETLRSAHDGLVHAYAAAGRPDRAHVLFDRLAPDRSVALQERLALAYFARGQHRESATAYRGLLRRHPDAPDACAWQMRLLLTAVARRDLDAQLREATRLATLGERSTDPRCRADARDALTDLAQQWHVGDPPRATRICAAYARLFSDRPIPPCP